MSNTNDLNALRDAVYQDAVKHGLWDDTDEIVQDIIEAGKRDGDLFDPDDMMRGCAMQVISREVDELKYASEDGEAYAEELADVVIAALSVAGKLGIDIDAAVKRKMEINKGRSYKHERE